MINEALLISNITGLVGFRNSTLPEYSDLVSTTNQTSDSGQYYQSGHALVSIKNIKETCENKDISRTDFNTLLTNLQNDALIRLCRKIVNDKTRHLSAFVHYPNRQSFVSTYSVGTGFLGMEMGAIYNEDILVKISAITASFDSAISLTIYLYSSETGTAINSQAITTADKEAVRQSVNWSVSLNKDRSGGSYYIGYHSSGLSGASPYKRDYDNAACSNTFFSPVYNLWETSGTRIEPESFTAIEEFYGINLEYDVYTDYTMKLIRNKYMLVEALKLQVAEMVMEQILNTTRSNVDERLLKEARNLANYNLDGSPSSIRNRLDKEINSIRKALWPEPLIYDGTLT